MNLPKINVLLGSELSDAQIEFMNHRRIMEYGVNTKDFKKNEQESIFFSLTEDDAVRAFGMLKSVDITHSDQHYSILGIGAIMAVEKGKGYGKTLMESIQHYLAEHDKTGLGFCDHKVCPFYLKCGFKVDNGLSERFRYRYAAEDGQKEKLDRPRGVLYLEGSDNAVRHLLADQELIHIEKPFW